MRYLTLALATVLATASAQQTTKPEIVQLRDEPGRNPFQQTVVNDTCEEAMTCQVTFNAVPANTRLVVTRFNASAFTTNGSNTMVYSVLTDAAGNIANTFPHTTPVSSTSFANESTLAYFDAKDIPLVKVNNQTGLINIQVTLSGYLVHLP
jgi:hypothetical protein